MMEDIKSKSLLHNHSKKKENMKYNLIQITQFFLMAFIMIMLSPISKAQEPIMKDQLITSIMSCPNNPQCIYSGEKLFPIQTKIINHSDQNLQIPLKAIKSFWRSVAFKDIQTEKQIGKFHPPAMYIPDFVKDLTLLPAHGEIVIDGRLSQEGIESAFHDAKSKQILYTSEINTPIYYQGSKQAIGYYKDGGYEEQNFELKSQIIITKK